MTVLLFLSLITAFADEPKLALLKLPPGYSISVFARVPDARSMALGTKGTVFMGNRREGSVYAIKPDRSVIKIISGLNMPNGVAFKGGDLYVAEVHRVLRFRDIENRLDKKAEYSVFYSGFPTDAHHGWKFIAFGPDGWLYVPVGAPCNVCLKDQNTFAAIHRISADGRHRQLVAKGIRNTVGFDWHPSSNNLWFTDNGRDHMGDDKPPCELNQITKNQEHFGFPFCHGTSDLDPEFGQGKSCDQYSLPKYEFPAHSAPLGMRFLNSKEILVAEHGSWNRSSPIGYQVTRILLKDDRVVKGEPFVSGFLQNGQAWGRPVDILPMPDRSILISDDKVGAVYRLQATGQNSSSL